MAVDLSRMSAEDVNRIAHAAGWDAGESARRARGGEVWDQGDFYAAAREFERVMAAAGMPGYGEHE